MSNGSRLAAIEKEICKADEMWWCGIWYGNEEKPEPPPNKKNRLFIHITGMPRPNERKGKPHHA